jgi:hypothetical protein
MRNIPKAFNVRARQAERDLCLRMVGRMERRGRWLGCRSEVEGYLVEMRLLDD